MICWLQQLLLVIFCYLHLWKAGHSVRRNKQPQRRAKMRKEERELSFWVPSSPGFLSFSEVQSHPAQYSSNKFSLSLDRKKKNAWIKAVERKGQWEASG